MINSILKALDILDLFNSTQPRLSLAEICTRVDMPKSTVFNLLKTLESRGFIEQMANGDYAMGTAPIVLSQSARVNVELRDRAAPLLRELADVCHESIYLSVRDGDNILYIYAIESRHRLMARSAIGERVPLHCTAIGKSILAQSPVSEITEYAQRTALPRFTENTITTVEALCKEIEKIMIQGYALDSQEHELQTYCIGASILDARARAVGAFSISGNDPEIIGIRLPLLVEQMKYTAQEISRRMGFVPATISQVTNLSLGRE